MIAKFYDVLVARFAMVKHTITLIELSLDFSPRKHLAVDEKVHLRERIVGLLQRHHWCELPNAIHPRADARQVYLRDPNGKKVAVTSFLFPVKGSAGRNKPDNAVFEKSVQERLSRPQLPSGLFLDATVYKGDQIDDHFERPDSAGYTIRIQHKVTDKSNPVTGNIDPLGDDKKRARVEVTVSARACCV